MEKPADGSPNPPVSRPRAAKAKAMAKTAASAVPARGLMSEDGRAMPTRASRADGGSQHQALNPAVLRAAAAEATFSVEGSLRRNTAGDLHGMSMGVGSKLYAAPEQLANIVEGGSYNAKVRFSLFCPA